MSQKLFRRGNITRLYMKNFLTYDLIQIDPLPHLNVIIGPNGTGKSSILCAICLGLGGKPEVTGRGKHAIDYIQHGFPEAIVEIELYDTPKSIYVRRVISTSKRTSGTSEYFLNGACVSEKKVQETVQKLGIKIGNLCTFLPQDRVIEFAKLNKIQLLQSTELAVGCDELANQHQILRDFGKNVKELQQDNKDLNDQLQQEVSTNEKLQDQVKNIEKREDLDKSVKDLNEVILTKKYIETHREYKRIDAVLKAAKLELAELQKHLAPCENKEQNIIKDLQAEKNSLEQQSSFTMNKKTEIDRLKNDISTCESQIPMAQEDFKNAEESHAGMTKEINNMRKQIEVLRGQIRDMNNVDETQNQQRMQELNHQINSKCKVSSEEEEKRNNLVYEMKSIQSKIEGAESQLSRSQNIKMQRLRVLLDSKWHGFRKKQYSQIYDAAKWIHENQSTFEGTVHDPLYCCIDLEDMAYARHLENTVSNRDLIAFVCENKNDIKRIKQMADKRSWTVNLVHSDDLHPERYTPQYPIEKLRHECGFDTYLKDVVDAPPAVLSYLCKNFKLHQIPVSKQQADFDKVPANISLFFMGEKRCFRKKSSYDGAVSTNISDIVARAQFITIADNSKEQEELKKKINYFNGILMNLNNSSEESSLRIQQIDAELQELRKENNSLKQRKHLKKQQEQTLKSKEESLFRKYGNLIDLDDAKASMEREIKKTVEQMLAKVLKLFSLEKAISDILRSVLSRRFSIARLMKELDDLKKDMEEDEAKIETKKEELETLTAESKEAYDKASGYLNDMKNIFGGSNIQIKEKMRRTLNEKAKNNSSIEVLERELAQKEAMRDCIANTDESVVDEYKKREEKIVRLRLSLEESNRGISKSREDVQQCRDEWLPQITALTEEINTHFASFMAKLDCAGEVLLDKGVNEEDFTNYGLAIKVKFRDDEKLRDLTSTQQSGGERSVSTALYLMALQTLTAVPFRCVDEINQGMDPTNERNMFTMLVETTTTPNASQYFLVTPKLLPNLPYNERVTFMNVFNGPKLEKPKLFTVDKTLEHLRKKKNRR